MEDIVEETIEKKSSNNSFVEVGSIEVPKEEVVEHDTESYFDGKLLTLLAFSYFYATITVLTAGLLSAWGKCLLNEYIYNHTVISGKRLKFEGSGKDLFPRMFKWDFFKLITFNIYSIWAPTRYKEWEVSKLHFEDEKLVEGSSYFTGSVLGYFGIRILSYLITVVSFGLLQPVAYVIKLKWELEHTIINNKVVVFRGSSLSYLGKRILWTLLSAVTFGIYGFWIHINTLKWQFSNTFLLRKNDKDAKEINEKANENVSAARTSSSTVKSGKKPNKIAILVIALVVLSILIFLIVKIASQFGPASQEYEDEMYTVVNETRNELVNMAYHDKADDTSKKQNIKKLNFDSLNKFLENGGKGTYSNYYYDEYYDDYYNNYDKSFTMQLQLRKGTTYCTVSISSNEYYPISNFDCRSFKEELFKRLNIGGSSSGMKNVEDYGVAPY